MDRTTEEMLKSWLCGQLLGGCVFVAFWVFLLGGMLFLIISSYLEEDGHHPAGKTASHELHYHHK
jgi:hypothetical protein